jgi:hypothetical protein
VSEEDRAALIERLRRSDIRIDREGQLWHEGQTIDHAGLRQALFRWLDRLPDGRYVFRLDAQRYAYLGVEDTPLVVRAARWDGERLLLSLSDGAEEPLDPATMTIDGEGILRCLVRDGRLEARLSTSAATVAAERISGEPPRLGSAPIKRRSGSPP